MEYVKHGVASLKNGETGEPGHKRIWNSAELDLPVVNQKEQPGRHLRQKPSTNL
jgi:hypothetical protein